MISVTSARSSSDSCGDSPIGPSPDEMAAGGQCIRFPLPTCVSSPAAPRWACAGIALAQNDTLISLAILRHVGATSDERSAFPVEESDQIMLVTDKGQLIRCPVEGIRIAGRSTQGVIVFDTAEDEHVVSVEHICEDTENGNGNGH
jgi:hypothetical protein